MQKHIHFVAAAVLAAGLSSPAWTQETDAPSAGTVVATVNGQEITLGHMIAARATLDERYNEAPADQLFAGILQQLIQQEAMSQQIDTLPPLVALTLENEARSLKAGAYIERRLENAISEEDIQTAYDEAFAEFESAEEFNASHILVATEDEAIAVKELLDGGADFAATAREKSTGPSGPNGGSLGWFGTGMMVPSFEAAAIALGVGEISQPVETQFGWHVILLNDTRKTEAPALEEVRENLLQNLRNEAVLEIIGGATEGIDLVIPEDTDIDPAILTQRELLEQ
jgi:peptidyl-prolyl cis-trans isomerase C